MVLWMAKQWREIQLSRQLHLAKRIPLWHCPLYAISMVDSKPPTNPYFEVLGLNFHKMESGDASS
jgi:valyl-tRNA synthetase